MITNPGNPNGVTLTKEEMHMIARVAKEHDLYLISDEVYREFCYGENAGVPTMGEFMDEIADNLIITDSVSKQFAHWRRAKKFVVFCICHLTVSFI